MNFLSDFFLPVSSIPVILRDRKLLRLAIIPWLINIALFFVALVAFGWMDQKLMTTIAGLVGDGWWTPIITWTLGIILFLAFGAGLILSFVFFANLIGGIFFENLSQQTEFVLTGRNQPAPENSITRILIRTTIEEIKGLAFFLGIWIAMLLLYFVPLIGPLIFMIASAVWSAIAMAFEFTSPATERRGFKFTQKRQLIFAQPLRSAALGAGILLITFIPVLNVISLPFAVVAGTRWFLRINTGDISR